MSSTTTDPEFLAMAMRARIAGEDTACCNWCTHFRPDTFRWCAHHSERPHTTSSINPTYTSCPKFELGPNWMKHANHGP